MVDELTMAVVGARYDNPRRKGQPTGNRSTEILLCEPGERVELRLEPENEHDANAIAVYSNRAVQLGYLSADKTAIVHRALADGREPSAIFQAVAPWGCYVRVAFGGLIPQLPPPVEREADQRAAAPPPGDEWDGVDWIPPDE